VVTHRYDGLFQIAQQLSDGTHNTETVGYVAFAVGAR
jgi:hypothetical protein